MARTSVGILRGGTSSEYDLSLRSGAAMLAALHESQFDARDIFIDKRGYWHLRGAPVDAARALAQIDVALNALHGGVGEDGTVQRIHSTKSAHARRFSKRVYACRARYHLRSTMRSPREKCRTSYFLNSASRTW